MIVVFPVFEKKNVFKIYFWKVSDKISMHSPNSQTPRSNSAADGGCIGFSFSFRWNNLITKLSSYHSYTNTLFIIGSRTIQKYCIIHTV